MVASASSERRRSSAGIAARDPERHQFYTGEVIPLREQTGPLRTGECEESAALRKELEKLLQKVRARATLLLRRWGRSTAFFVRFAYGLRLILPLTMGATRFSFRLFVPFNALGSLAFAGIYLLLGFFFGEAVGGLLERIEGAESWVLVGIAVLGGAFDVGTMDALNNLRQRYIPNKLLAYRSEPTRPGATETAAGNEAQRGIRSAALDPLFAGKETLDPPPTVYICEEFACQAPVAGVGDAIAAWERLAS